MTKVSRSRVFGWLALGLVGAALVQSCSASSADAPDDLTGGTAGSIGTDSGDGQVVNPPGNGGAGGEPAYSPLCGVVTCLPDERSACLAPDAGTSGTSSSGTSGTSGRGSGGIGEGGAPGHGGSAGAPAEGGNAGEGGRPSTAGSGSGADSGDGSGATGATTPERLSCQVSEQGGEPLARCLPAGEGLADAPCLAGDDCAPGLACVSEGDAGQCRPYCCDAGSCEARTHCLERALIGVSTEIRVPVCVPAVDCGLAEPFPCPDGATCSCPADLACMVVSSDATTTCIRPGVGSEGEACPCAWGHVCSQATGRCVKLCQTAAPDVGCATGMCQVSPELPAGWGVCVGVPPPDAG